MLSNYAVMDVVDVGAETTKFPFPCTCIQHRGEQNAKAPKQMLLQDQGWKKKLKNMLIKELELKYTKIAAGAQPEVHLFFQHSKVSICPNGFPNLIKIIA